MAQKPIQNVMKSGFL